jgi:hypothetical protein
MTAKRLPTRALRRRLLAVTAVTGTPPARARDAVERFEDRLWLGEESLALLPLGTLDMGFGCLKTARRWLRAPRRKGLT